MSFSSFLFFVFIILPTSLNDTVRKLFLNLSALSYTPAIHAVFWLFKRCKPHRYTNRSNYKLGITNISLSQELVLRLKLSLYFLGVNPVCALNILEK